MFTLKIGCIFLILLSTLLAAVYPFLRSMKHAKKADFPLGEALSSGIFLGAGLLHMLQEASTSFSKIGYVYPVAFLLAGVTFLILLLFEHICREIYEHKNSNNAVFVYLTVTMLSIHSFLEGAALGLSDSYSIMIIIFIAILAHKWAASFALAVQINKSNLSVSSGLLFFTVFALMTPLGILSGTTTMNHIKHYPLLEPIFISLAAGTFLYLGTLHGLKQAVMIDKCCDLRHFMFVVFGFIVMAVVAIWA